MSNDEDFVWRHARTWGEAKDRFKKFSDHEWSRFLDRHGGSVDFDSVVFEAGASRGYYRSLMESIGEPPDCYTQDEWAAICSCLSDIEPLDLIFICDKLEWYGLEYRWWMIGAANSAVHKKVISLLQELLGLLCDEKTARIVASTTRAWPLEDFNRVVRRLLDGHDAQVARQQDIRLAYYSALLRLWTEEIGGALKFSRHPLLQVPDGPLIRFLHAVTAPVMREDAPSLETLADAVIRERSKKHNLPS
jgi:hypothetical protein